MNQGNAPARRTDMKSLLARVDDARTQISKMLPPGIEIDRFMALARRSVAENPELAECTTVSVLRSLSDCAQSGLALDGKQSALIVRKMRNGQKVSRWDPMYSGMIAMAMASGFVTDVFSAAVTENDDFKVELGTEPKVHHVPSLLTGGRIVAAYAWARLRSGRLVIEVLGRDDLDKIKKASPAGERGPWGHWESQMARKSAVRRLLKKLPSAPFRAVLDDAEPYAMSGTMGAPDAPAISAPAILPEDEHALECRALEKVNDARDEAERMAAWATIQAMYAQAGIEIPEAVSNAFDAASAPGSGPIDDPWVDEYEAG